MMQIDHLKRREFVSLLGGAVAWPVVARAQQPDRMRRIGVLMGAVGSNEYFLGEFIGLKFQ